MSREGDAGAKEENSQVEIIIIVRGSIFGQIFFPFSSAAQLHGGQTLDVDRMGLYCCLGKGQNAEYTPCLIEGSQTLKKVGLVYRNYKVTRNLNLLIASTIHMRVIFVIQNNTSYSK